MRTTHFALAAFAAMLLAGPAHALYRCGNVFQDRPCDGAAPQQAAPSGGSTASPGAGVPLASTRASPHAAACSRAGEHAQRIQWQREGGATMEKQLSELARGREREEIAAIIHSVYSRRGTAPEIRAAVEAECVQRKEEAAAAAAQMQLLRQQAGQAPVEVRAPVQAAAESAAQPPASAPSRTTGSIDDKGRTCANLRDEVSFIESRLRAGGSAQTMETWQQRRREAEKRVSEAGC